jgi:hypothetical protein
MIGVPEHLSGLVIRREPRGAYICKHERQLTVCRECCEKAEQFWKEAQKELTR